MAKSQTGGIKVSHRKPLRAYVTMRLEPGTVKLSRADGYEEKLQIGLPEGCKGILFAFRSKEAARKYYDKNIPLVEIEESVEIDRD